MTSELFRLYGVDELARDGYPPEWHRVPDRPYGIKDLVREAAGHRCVRCGHPYRSRAHGGGEWSPCDERCTHVGPVRVQTTEGWRDFDPIPGSVGIPGLRSDYPGVPIQARWRILTVHHLIDKVDCREWAMVALCQRCHLQIQGKVHMERAFIFEHSDWFKPYVAGWYAWKYLGEEITLAEARERQDDLLALERLA